MFWFYNLKRIGSFSFQNSCPKNPTREARPFLCWKAGVQGQECCKQRQLPDSWHMRHSVEIRESDSGVENFLDSQPTFLVCCGLLVQVHQKNSVRTARKGLAGTQNTPYSSEHMHLKAKTQASRFTTAWRLGLIWKTFKKFFSYSLHTILY